MTAERKWVVDVPKISEADATQLAVHHLMLASRYWEVANEDELRAAIEREFGGPGELGLVAARAWWTALKVVYDKEGEG